MTFDLDIDRALCVTHQLPDRLHSKECWGIFGFEVYCSKRHKSRW